MYEIRYIKMYILSDKIRYINSLYHKLFMAWHI
jgi:hypothetical protein